MVKRWLLAGAMALALTAADAATTTTQVSLSNTAYTDLGAGPMILGAVGGAVQYQVADSQPAANTPALGAVYLGEAPVNLQVSSHVWARGNSVMASAIVGAGTGITGWGGTGGGGGGSSGFSATDASAFTSTTSPFEPFGGVYWTSPPALTNGNQGAAAMTSARSVHTLDDNSAAELAAIQSPLAAQTGAVWIGNVGQYSGASPWVVSDATVVTAIAAAAITPPSAATPVVSASAEASHVLKASAGNLRAVYATNLTTTAGFLLVINATSAPADGAVTPLECVPLPASGNAAVTYGDWSPSVYSTGITAVVTSAATCFTKTTGVITAFIHGSVQ